MKPRVAVKPQGGNEAAGGSQATGWMSRRVAALLQVKRAIKNNTLNCHEHADTLCVLVHLKKSMLNLLLLSFYVQNDVHKQKD